MFELHENSLSYESIKIIQLYIFHVSYKKYILTVRNYEGDTFSQASEVQVQVCKPAKIAARWRC